MPRDNSRQGKSINNLRRTTRHIESRGNYLIIVEGITEKKYFECLKDDLKIKSIDIRIFSADGGDPLEIIEYTYNLYQDFLKKREKGAVKLNKVFCVFDDDKKPEKYKAALNKAKKYDFTAITSIPCFEFWFLLHYCYTTGCFVSYDDLRPKLETEMRKAGILKKDEAYSKSDVELYTKLKPNQDNAINNATKLAEKHPNEDGCTNPSTKVHLLVKELQNQKDFK
ncbi:MAG TPA: RloB family protein [Nostocaceae cyanobacterium]|nr:RloB family protein [Nostocaceae cyanobacterium]